MICFMCHKEGHEEWNCFILCEKCGDEISAHITSQNPPDES